MLGFLKPPFERLLKHLSLWKNVKKATAQLAFKMLLKLHRKAYSLNYWRIDQSQYIRGHGERKEIILMSRDVNYMFFVLFSQSLEPSMNILFMKSGLLHENVRLSKIVL